MSKISIFISYSRKDIEFAEKLYHDLSEQDFDVWWDKEKLDNRGTTFLQEIRDAIASADRLVLVVSPDSIESEYVRYEWEHALKLCKAINPVLLRGTYESIPSELALFDAPNFTSDDYEAKFDYLTRQMKEAVPLGALRGDVPQLPLYYLQREEAFQQLRDYVLRDVKTTTAITGKAKTTGIQGMGGIGKSVLATAIAHDCEIRRSFADGVYWLTLGQKPELKALHSALSVALGEKASFDTITEWKAHAQRLLEGKQCLLVLDDVWEKSHADAFSVLSNQSRMLVTSRDVGLVQSLEAREFSLDILDEGAALQLLAQAADTSVEALPDTAYEVAKECGYLPLALTMVGAMIADDIDWEDVLEALQNADLEEIEADFDYPYPSVFAAIEVSIKALGENEVRYLELAAFKEDARIPEETLVRYWQHTSQNSKLKAKKLLKDFEKKALLRRDDENRFYLHDLQYDYIRKQAEKSHDVAHYHKLFLAAYNPDNVDWLDIEWDTYLYEEIAYHLAGAEKLDILRDLLLNFNFLQNKLDKTTPNSLIADCGYISDERATQLIQSALSISSNILKEDASQLGSQLIARLMSHREKQPKITTLLEVIRTDKSARLFPHGQTFQPAGGALIRTLVGHSGAVNAIVFSDDKKFAISASEDRTLKVWNWQTGEELRTLQGHRDSVISLALSGKYAVSASGYVRHTLKVWNWQTGEELWTQEGNYGTVIGMTLSGDSVVISSGETIKVWNWQTDKELRTLQGFSSNSSENSVALSGEYAVSASGYTLKVWNWQTGELLRSLNGHSSLVNGVALSGEFAVSTSGYTLRVWNWQTGELLHTLEGHLHNVNSVALSREYAVSVSADHTLKVWNWQTGDLLRTLHGHSFEIRSVALSGEFAVSASRDNTLKVWNWQMGKELQTLQGHTDWVKSVELLGEYVVSASRDKAVKVWNWQTGEELRTLHGHKGYTTSAALSGEFAVSASRDNTLKVWNWQTGDILRTLEGHSSFVNGVALSGEFAVSASSDNTLKVWNWQIGDLLRTLEGHSRSVERVVLSGEFAISVSHDEVLKVWNWQTGEELRTLQGHTSWVNSVALSGEFVVSASLDNTLKVWNWQTGEELRTLQGHTSWVNNVALSGEFAVSASNDKTLKVWNWQTGNYIYTFYLDAPVRCVAIVDDRSTIIAGDNTSKVHFLRLNAGLKKLLGW